MKNCKEIYLLGPGRSKLDFDVTQLRRKTTLNFSGDLVWFSDNNIYPSYWTFFDPNSTLYIFDRYKNNKYNLEWFEGLKTNSNIIFNDFQGTDKFYNEGFTTSRGKVWNKNEFGDQILPSLCSQFKEIIKVPTTVLYNTFDSFYNEETKHLTPIIKHEEGINTDKLTCFILPLVLSYFTKLESIKCIGFGDFESPRLGSGSSLGYNGYKLSYQRMKEKLITLLKYKNVKIEFNNKDSYFKELEWKK